MFVHPLNDEHKFVSDIDQRSIQPNAVDIRAARINLVEDIQHTYSIYHDQLLTISDDLTEHKTVSLPIEPDSDGWWVLDRGIYQFTSESFTTIPVGYCGWLITRSSLNRNGVFVMSGLYDSGFHGYVGGTLYNLAGRIKIKQNTRICQLVVANAETKHLYQGQYNHKK